MAKWDEVAAGKGDVLLLLSLQSSDSSSSAALNESSTRVFVSKKLEWADKSKKPSNW